MYTLQVCQQACTEAPDKPQACPQTQQPVAGPEEASALPTPACSMLDRGHLSRARNTTSTASRSTVGAGTWKGGMVANPVPAILAGAAQGREHAGSFMSSRPIGLTPPLAARRRRLPRPPPVHSTLIVREAVSPPARPGTDASGCRLVCAWQVGGSAFPQTDSAGGTQRQALCRVCVPLPAKPGKGSLGWL